ncbi:YidC/Oxa1 family membrane protein insertase [Anaerovibrio sp. RM50]|uniref:YidC/Oxa1 family membrane protein insertase n=1 Tax=Anaerovibrio sp. RM50 TaxID=1200557 RepID=UPI0004879B2D|nr:YidC/Oxa1 family membrane protein insertase [Anaerovibrio sp. RM50]
MDFLASAFEPVVELFRVIMGGFYGITEMAGFPSYGVAIILMTICVKLCLYPLNAKQIKSMKAMQEIQPQLKKIQKDYKNNPQLMQQKMGELYQESGVNPLAGCLPLLVQMPILMGVYYSLYGLEYSGDPTFLWLTSLSDSDPTYILPLLSALTTYLAQRQSMSVNGQENQQMKMMMYIMPIFIGYISINFPAGLVLYWVVMNICQMVQQWYMFRNEDKKEAA